jgi:hypothetical protein
MAGGIFGIIERKDGGGIGHIGLDDELLGGRTTDHGNGKQQQQTIDKTMIHSFTRPRTLAARVQPALTKNPTQNQIPTAVQLMTVGIYSPYGVALIRPNPSISLPL